MTIDAQRPTDTRDPGEVRAVAQLKRDLKRVKRAARKPAKTLREAIERTKAPAEKTIKRDGTQTAKIRALGKQGLKNNEIAKKLKVNPGTVWHALHGK